MHIPSGCTTELDILTFEEALKSANTENDSYNIREWIYAPNFYAEYRYILGTRGSHPLICIGINPSTAEPCNLDNTLKSVHRIAEGNGYDSFIMFNVYAQRATDPSSMEKQCNPLLHEENMKAFRYVLSISESPIIWAAWGSIIEKRKYLSDCLKDMISIGKEYHAKWVSAGPISKKGHPHHPLYLRKDAILDPFDIENYILTH